MAESGSGVESAVTFSVHWGPTKRMLFHYPLHQVQLKQLLDAVSEQSCCPRDTIKLLYSGVVMRDEKAHLAQFGIRAGSRVLMLSSWQPPSPSTQPNMDAAVSAMAESSSDADTPDVGFYDSLIHARTSMIAQEWLTTVADVVWRGMRPWWPAIRSWHRHMQHLLAIALSSQEQLDSLQGLLSRYDTLFHLSAEECALFRPYLTATGAEEGGDSAWLETTTAATEPTTNTNIDNNNHAAAGSLESGSLPATDTPQQLAQLCMTTYRQLSEHFLQVLLKLDAMDTSQPCPVGTLPPDPNRVSKRRQGRKVAIQYVQRFLTHLDGVQKLIPL